MDLPSLELIPAPARRSHQPEAVGAALPGHDSNRFS